MKPDSWEEGSAPDESAGGGKTRRIAVRYCGGCNPTYERVEAILRLRAALGDRVTFVRPDEPPLDAVVMVCGCDTACPMEELPSAGIPTFALRSETDLDRAVAFLAGEP